MDYQILTALGGIFVYITGLVLWVHKDLKDNIKGIEQRMEASENRWNTAFQASESRWADVLLKLAEKKT